MGEVETGQADVSSKELNEEAVGDSTKQMTEHHFEEKKVGERDEEESGIKQMPRACKWLSWWKKRWQVLNDIQSREERKKEKIPSTETEKEPEGAKKNPDKTCGEEHDKMAKKRSSRGDNTCFTLPSTGLRSCLE